MKGKAIMVLLLLLPIHASITRAWQPTAVHVANRSDERKLRPGSKVQIRNPSGSITITGWKRDTMRATATSTDGAPVDVVFGETSSASLTVTIATTATNSRSRINLDVSLPRETAIELASAFGGVSLTNTAGAAIVQSRDGNITVSKTAGRIVVKTINGNVEAQSVGSLVATSERGTVRVSRAANTVTIVTGGGINADEIGGDLIAKSTKNGGVNVNRARGLVDLSVVNGGVIVRNADGDVRIASINGGVHVVCVKGRVEVGNINGQVTLERLDGDVDAVTSNTPIQFTGAIYAGRRYRLKSHIASVSMTLPPNTPGFTATLSSYKGGIETDFPLATGSPFSNRRFIGRYRAGEDNRISIQLDSFNGTVKLIRTASAISGECSR